MFVMIFIQENNRKTVHCFGLKRISLKCIAFFYCFFLDLEIDPCIRNDCDPVNGECIPSGNTFMCMCRAGYTGDGKSCTRNHFFHFQVFPLKLLVSFTVLRSIPTVCTLKHELSVCLII